MTCPLYTIRNRTEDTDGATVASVALNAQHPVFAAHFPQRPILPGVYSLEIVKVCAECFLQTDLQYTEISSCKFLKPVEPEKSTVFELTVKVAPAETDSNEYQLSAKGEYCGAAFLKLKARLRKKEAKTSPCLEVAKDLQIGVVVPVYNNGTTIRKVVEGCLGYCSHVFVIDDGSADQTPEILAGIPGIQIITHSKNRGKGAALKTGLLAAKAAGCRYALTIDADGQHFPSDIPLFFDAIKQEPDLMLVGARCLDAQNMPSKNTFANRFSNFWFRIETGVKLNDTQSGFRLYPLQKIGKMKHTTSGYEFELLSLVSMSWRGVRIKNIPVNVYYPPRGERVSHFRPLRDFTRISLLNTVLVFIALFYIYPLKLFKRQTWRNIKAFFDREILHSSQSNTKIVQAIMLGIFMGIIPLWGYQMLITVFLASYFKLSRVIALVASNISIPPMIPFLLYGSYFTGCLITGADTGMDLGDISFQTVKEVLVQYLIGSVVFALVCSMVIGGLSWLALLVFRKKGR